MRKWFVRTSSTVQGTVYCVCRGTARHVTNDRKSANALVHKLNHSNLTVDTATRLRGGY